MGRATDYLIYLNAKPKDLIEVKKELYSLNITDKLKSKRRELGLFKVKTLSERIHENALRFKAKEIEEKGFSRMARPEAKQRVIEINKLLGTNYAAKDDYTISKN